MRDSENGEPLPGVTVVASTSGKTSISDGNGEFSIAITPNDKQLTFSYVGYKSLEKRPIHHFQILDFLLKILP